MLEYQIKNTLKKHWQGTQDNHEIRYALETARTFGNRETVNQNWRWLADDMSELYESNEPIAAATRNYLLGWIDGASQILDYALAVNPK